MAEQTVSLPALRTIWLSGGARACSCLRTFAGSMGTSQRRRASSRASSRLLHRHDISGLFRDKFGVLFAHVEEMKATVSISKPMRGIVYAWEGEVDELRKLLHASERRAEELEADCGIAVIARRRAEKERDEARSSLARVVEALEFYANPWKFKDAYGEPVRVPDFYSELDFADRARSALHRSQGE